MEGLLGVWRQQLQQFSGISETMAQAIAANFPSPFAIRCFVRARTRESAVAEIANIRVQRLSSERRLGEAAAGMLFDFFTAASGTPLID